MRFQSNIFWTCPSRACATTSWPAIKVALATTSWPAVKVALATTGWRAMPDAADSPPRKGSIADMMRKGASDVMSSFSSGAKRSRVAASGDFDDVSEAGAATRRDSNRGRGIGRLDETMSPVARGRVLSRIMIWRFLGIIAYLAQPKPAKAKLKSGPTTTNLNMARLRRGPRPARWPRKRRV